MARIRSVHPALFTDEAWVSCSLAARLLHIALWTDADDQGVFEWKPLQIKMRLMPGDDVKVDQLLVELSEVDLVRGFSEAGKNYGAIKDFQKWQRPKKPRAVYPLPADLKAYVTGAGEAQPDLFGENAGGRSGEKSPQMEDGEERRMEDGGGTRARRKPETPIPEGFPDAEALAKAEEQITEARVILDPGRQAVRFRAHAETNDRRCRDWRAAWRNWVDKGIETAPVLVHSIAPEAQLTAAESAAIDLRKHRFWMEDWKKGNPWDRKIRGPRPDEIGCAVPAPIMAEFGHTPVRRAEG